MFVLFVGQNCVEENCFSCGLWYTLDTGGRIGHTLLAREKLGQICPVNKTKKDFSKSSLLNCHNNCYKLYSLRIFVAIAIQQFSQERVLKNAYQECIHTLKQAIKPVFVWDSANMASKKLLNISLYIWNWKLTHPFSSYVAVFLTKWMYLAAAGNPTPFSATVQSWMLLAITFGWLNVIVYLCIDSLKGQLLCSQLSCICPSFSPPPSPSPHPCTQWQCMQPSVADPGYLEGKFRFRQITTIACVVTLCQAGGMETL